MSPPGGSSYGGFSTMGSLGPPAAKVIQLVGHHFHNPSDPNEFAENGGEAYLRKTLLRNLKFGKVDLPPTLEEQLAGHDVKTVTMSDLGISYPVLLYVHRPVEYGMINPDLGTLETLAQMNVTVDPQLQELLDRGQSGGVRGGFSSDGGRAGGMARGSGPQMLLSQFAAQRGVREPVIMVRRFEFVIQFAWEETLPSQRREDASGGEENGVGAY